MAIIGYAIVNYENGVPLLEASGSIQTDKNCTNSERLLVIYNDMSTIAERYHPLCAAVEELYFFRNQKTVIPVAQARGVILTVLEKYKIKINEYTPIEVKQVLTGYGRAEKKEVEQMVRLALNNELKPKLDDTIDAIAIAICHGRKLLL